MKEKQSLGSEGVCQELALMLLYRLPRRWLGVQKEQRKGEGGKRSLTERWQRGRIVLHVGSPKEVCGRLHRGVIRSVQVHGRRQSAEQKRQEMGRRHGRAGGLVM